MFKNKEETFHDDKIQKKSFNTKISGTPLKQCLEENLEP